MSCPNRPPCGHTGYVHDLDDAELSLGVALGELDPDDVLDGAGPLPRCHMLGCRCGTLPAGAVPAPRRVA